VHQLTNDPAQDWDPAFTPAGDGLLWSSDRGGHLEIWRARISVDSSGVPVLSGYAQVSSDGVDAENPTMTHDQWVVYASGNPASPGIWKVRFDGTNAEVLVPGAKNFLPEVSPNGRYALFVENDQYRFNATIRVVEIETKRLEDFEIVLDDRRDAQNAGVNRGRARWVSDDRIMFIGQTGSGTVGVFEQAFRPGQDTSATRRLVVPSMPDSGRLTESFDVSPDGTRITVSFANYTRNIMRADGVPGVAWPPRGAR
jgi:hypothetical protein